MEGRLKQSFSDGLETVKIINVETIYSNYDKPNKTIFSTYAMIHFLSQNISSKQATAIGLLAVALWSFVISLIRSLSLHMGAVGGAAMMYTLSTVLIWLIFGRPHLRNYNRSYLFWASVFLSAANCVCRSRSVLRKTRDRRWKSAWSIICGRRLPSSERYISTNSRQNGG